MTKPVLVVGLALVQGKEMTRSLNNGLTTFCFPHG
jgi:hypothetical protein